MKIFSLSYFKELSKFLPLLMGFLISFSFAYYAITTSLNERTIDWKVYDLYNRYYPQTTAVKNIIIIDVDDQSLEALGQWPWPRYRLAEALRLILDGRPSAVLVDILLAEKDRSSLVNIEDLFATEFGIQLNLKEIPEALKDNDVYFAKVIKNTPVILPSVLTQHKVYKEAFCYDRFFKQENHNQHNYYKKLNGDKKLNLDKAQYQGIICPLNSFSENSAGIGFINATIDADGLLRRTSIIKQYKDKLLPSLSLAGLMVLLGADFEIDHDSLGNVVKLNNYQIPVDNEGNALINFRGKGRHYQTIPILKLLSGTIPSQYFMGKVVLLGATASALNDIVNTHLDPVFPNIESHATLIDNVLNNDVLRIPIWFELLEMMIIFVFGTLLSILIFKKGASFYNFFIISLLSFLIISPAILLYNFQIYFSPFLSVVSLLTVYIVVSALKYYTTEKHLVSVLNSISKANLSIIDSMATVAELRDSETGGHIIRTRLYVKALIEHLQTKQQYKDQINDDYIKFLCAAAPLHDIGKVGIPDHILLKPGKLTEDEFVIMRTHAALGGDILRQTIQKVGPNPYLKIAIEIANYHHEKWDGKGYPLGLKGEAIPLSARVMAIADVFDALINKRIYKKAVSLDDTFDYIKQGAGTHFDPNVVEAFFEIKKDLLYIAKTIDD
ncbi:CHASE2 domain-containing protein [Vibrio sp. 2-Bac 85]